MTNLVIFASGSGSNAENLINYFQGHLHIQVTEVLSNNPKAYVHQRADNLGIPSRTFTKSEFTDTAFLKILGNADYIILAGFLWLIPNYLVQAFPNKIINIHPALLPKYGGKGMYGEYVHKAVIKAKEKESGITIHLVNEAYDEGEHLFQAKCPVEETDTPASLAQKIHQLEYAHFPQAVEHYITEARK